MTHRVPNIAQSDARADDLADCFDFNQKPRTYAPVPTTYVVRHDPPSSQPPDSD